MAAVYKKDAIYQQLKQDILSGKYAPGTKLPKELDFARQLGVAFNTLRSALAKLQEDQLILRLPSKGTFVSSNPVAPKLLVIYDTTSVSRTFPWHQLLPHLIELCAQQGIEIDNFDYNAFSALKKVQVERLVAERHITGVIFLGNGFTGNEPIIPLLKNVHLPVVITPAYEVDGQVTGFASIIMDVPKAWELGLRHLRDQGFYRVMTEVYEGDGGTIRRYSRAAYFQMLTKLGLSTAPELLLETPRHNHQVLREKLLQVFSNRSAFPHAVMCFTDFTANVLYDVLNELHLRIPQDVAVMGFGGALSGNLLEPGLSTIDLEFRLMAEHAFNLITSASEWFDPAHPTKSAPQIVAPFKLLCSGSTDIVSTEIADSEKIYI